MKKKEVVMKKAATSTVILGAALLLFASLTSSASDPPLTDIELLGKYVFFDKISEPKRMACVTCHNPKAGGTFGVAGTNKGQVAVTGANPHTVGNLKPPTNAYATFIGAFSKCPTVIPSGICGGNFWNGRSEGNASPLFPGSTATEHIGDEVFFTAGGVLDSALQTAYKQYLGPTAEQALNPFGNLVEQNIQRKDVCQVVKSAKYAPLFEVVWGEPIDCVETGDPNTGLNKSFKRLAVSLAAYQGSRDVNSFSSKRDLALANKADGKFPLAGLTDQENLGHDLFYGRNDSGLNPTLKNAGCTACHLSDRALADGTGLQERYTDDGYHHIGVPKNYEIPETFKTVIVGGIPTQVPIDPDEGLAGHTGIITVDPPGPAPAIEVLPLGLFKTPTLRNVAKGIGEGFPKAYTHNGWFKSLESIGHFYNTAAMQEDLAPFPFLGPKKHDVTRCPPEITTEKDALANNCWPAPAVNSPLSAIPFAVGNLGLTKEEEAAIVAYLKTLSDTYTAQAPKPYKNK
jgi:cytochrome c peroxidase